MIVKLGIIISSSFLSQLFFTAMSRAAVPLRQLHHAYDQYILKFFKLINSFPDEDIHPDFNVLFTLIKSDFVNNGLYGISLLKFIFSSFPLRYFFYIHL